MENTFVRRQNPRKQERERRVFAAADRYRAG